MSARNAKRKTEPQVVVVPPIQNGKHDVVAVRQGDTLMLSLSDFGPTLTIKNGERTEQREGDETYKIVCTVDENNDLVGWSVSKSGVSVADDTIITVTTKKTHATHARGKQNERAQA